MTELQAKIIAVKREIRETNSAKRRRDLEKHLKRLEAESKKR